jgi:hypothetical protein
MSLLGYRLTVLVTDAGAQRDLAWGAMATGSGGEGRWGPAMKEARGALPRRIEAVMVCNIPGFIGYKIEATDVCIAFMHKKIRVIFAHLNKTYQSDWSFT